MSETHAAPRVKAEDYGDSIAPFYDEFYPPLDRNDPAVVFLARLAGKGTALELGIGTGRIALPLAQRGVPIEGVDVSRRMVRRLRQKPGGMSIPVHFGSMSEISLGRKYRLIFALFNTFYSLPTEAEQRRCFERVAQHLEPGGSFVLQTFFPNLKLYEKGQAIRVGDLSGKRAVLELSRLDRDEHRVMTRRLIFEGGSYRMIPIDIRFAWPKELDRMAHAAGLRLVGRWDGWKKERFTASSKGMYVSVWRGA